MRIITDEEVDSKWSEYEDLPDGPKLYLVLTHKHWNQIQAMLNLCKHTAKSSKVQKQIGYISSAVAMNTYIVMDQSMREGGRIYGSN